MPISDYEIKFTKHTQISDVPPNFWQTAQKLMSRKVTSQTKESHTLEFTVTNKVGTKILNENIQGIFQQSDIPPLERHLFIPIALRNANVGELDKKEIIYVNINELAKKLLLSHNEVQKLISSINSADNEQLAALRAKTQLNMLLYKKARKDQAIQVLVPSLKQKLAEPIEEDTIQACNSYVLSRPKLESLAFQKIGQSEAFQIQRTSGSDTLQSADAALKSQSHANWIKADEFVRELAMQRVPLTLEIICQINRILRQDIEGENVEYLRDSTTSSGGLAGLEYPPHEILAAEMMNLIDWINQEVKKCREGTANPIEIGALANQRAVSFHPFNDANGRTCRLIMDYILQTCGLPPPVLGTDVKWALFGDQDVPDTEAASKTPTKAVKAVMEGIEKSYLLLESQGLQNSVTSM